jgi:CelD/BcsL family acetyltransferase involved in cellulose biosynthesis
VELYCQSLDLTFKIGHPDEGAFLDERLRQGNITLPEGGSLSKATVTVQTVTTVDGIAALGPCYERLHRITGNVLPFALHEWHLAWCRHLLNRSPRVHDEPLFYVLHDPAGACVAVIPFIVSRRRVGPLKIVTVNLLGADPAITEIRGPLIAPEYEYLAARAVRDQLAKIGDWDWIHWTGISDAFAVALAADRRLHWQPSLADYVLDLAPTWEEFRGRLKRNIRESLRHCYNSLKRDNHNFELHVIEDPPELRRGLDRFLELHALRADLKTTALHPNRFATQFSRNFLYEVCERMSRRGAMRLFQLKVGSEIVATRIGFLVGDSIYLYNSGFDPKWSRYSVMTTTVAEVIKYAIARGLKTVNLSPDKDVSKLRWSPRQVDYRSAYEHGRRLRSRLARRAYMTAQSGKGLQSWVLKRLIQARRNWQ